MTSILLDKNKVKVNKHNYLGQKSHTHPTKCSTWTIKVGLITNYKSKQSY